MQHIWVKKINHIENLRDYKKIDRFGPGWYVEPIDNSLVKGKIPPIYRQLSFNSKECGEPTGIIRFLRGNIESKINSSYLTCYWLIDCNLGKATIIIKSENQDVNNFFNTLKSGLRK
jgi:hypothetical protein